jgi:hypothetical protein
MTGRCSLAGRDEADLVVVVQGAHRDAAGSRQLADAPPLIAHAVDRRT